MADNDNRDDYIEYLTDEITSLESEGKLDAKKEAQLNKLKTERSKLAASIQATSSKVNKEEREKEAQKNLEEQPKNSSIFSALGKTKLDSIDNAKNLPPVKSHSKNNSQSL